MIYLPNIIEDDVTVLVPVTKEFSTRHVPYALDCRSTETLQWGPLLFESEPVRVGMYWEVTLQASSMEGMPSGEYVYNLVTPNGVVMESGVLMKGTEGTVPAEYDNEQYYITPEYGEE